MRTTLDIDDDVLHAAKDLARREKKSAGKVISELARRALNAPPVRPRAPKPLHGFRPFPQRGGIVTNELIDASRYVRLLPGKNFPMTRRALARSAESRPIRPERSIQPYARPPADPGKNHARQVR